MRWLRNFMMGRHGPDQLSIALTGLGFFLSLFSGLGRGRMTAIPDGVMVPVYAMGAGRWILLVSYVLLGLAVFRILSRNHEKRYAENERFLRFWNGLKNRFQGMTTRAKQAQHYHFYQCPKCAQKLRVPRGKGKLEITCPKCGEHFVKKT